MGEGAGKGSMGRRDREGLPQPPTRQICANAMGESRRSWGNIFAFAALQMLGTNEGLCQRIGGGGG